MCLFPYILWDDDTWLQCAESISYLCKVRFLHIDAKHSGVGSNACGEEQTYANKTRLNDYSMKLIFVGVDNESIIEESKKVKVMIHE